MSGLCLTCGMCCDGSLGLDLVEVTPDEATRLARHLRIVGQEVKLPCPALDGCRCTTYDDRPARCGSYRCQVLEAVDTGTMSDADAAELVARTRALATSVRARVPGSGVLWMDLLKHGEDTPAWRRANAELLLDVGMLRELVCRFDDRKWAQLRDRPVTSASSGGRSSPASTRR